MHFKIRGKFGNASLYLTVNVLWRDDSRCDTRDAHSVEVIDSPNENLFLAFSQSCDGSIWTSYLRKVKGKNE